MKKFLLNKIEIYVRNIEAGNFLEIFLVSAIASLLIVRAFLELAGYPTIGSGSFHIAHMLWGGFLMMSSIFLLLLFLNRQAKHLAALVGGVGFGMFIDELGKFITSDNDYFYRPAIALIYVVFLLLYFLVRYLDRKIPISSAGYTVNAMEIMKESVLKDMDEAEKQAALEMLSLSDPKDPLVSSLKLALESTSAYRGDKGALARLSSWLKNSYLKLLYTKWFSQGIVWFFALFAAVGFVKAIFGMRRVPDFADWGELLFSFVALAFVAAGIRKFKDRARLQAYRLFKYSVMVSIFFTQFFLFIKEQMSALIGLTLSLMVYGACQYLLAQEEKVQKEQKADNQVPALPLEQY